MHSSITQNFDSHLLPPIELLRPAIFLSDIKIMYPFQIMSQFVEKIMITQVFCGFFCNLKTKIWQSRKSFYLTMSAVAAASFQT